MIRACPLPDHALLRRYVDAGAYTDCYVTEIARPVTQAQFIEAFYTTWLFKLERWILSWAVARPSTDAQANALAAGDIQAFAAWRVEGRTANQLLMCDYQGRTRSWLMSVSPSEGGDTFTHLYFGSAVVPVNDPRSGQKEMGLVFRLLLGFHKLYSRALLRAAASRLLK